MRYHAERNTWSDQVGPYELRRMKAWDAQVDADAAYTQHGWSGELINADPYDGSPISGTIVRMTAGEKNWTQVIGGEPWRNAIDSNAVTTQSAEIELNSARAEARDLINSAIDIAKTTPIEYVLPAGSKLNGDATEGVTIGVYATHPELDIYWTEIVGRVNLRGVYDTEEFDAVEGRVEVPGSEFTEFLKERSLEISNRATTWRRLEAAFISCKTAEDYRALMQSIADKSMAAENTNQEPAVVEASSEVQLPESGTADANPTIVSLAADETSQATFGFPVSVHEEHELGGLYWTPVPDAVLYRLSWSMDGGVTWQPTIETPNNYYVVDQDALPQGTEVTYGLQAVKADGTKSQWSDNKVIEVSS